ncbi:hypothetical protein LCGC14_0395660 [marine sediment metagenome]|uniref:Uncharacterized protein n=1 Tax=marine sediment metagenome TaxID=412755 RepID=A0A0F9SYG3_9ZZZZ
MNKTPERQVGDSFTRAGLNGIDLEGKIPQHKRECSHSLGLVYYKDELDTTVSQDNISDVRGEYNENDIQWFKYCPYCGIELLPKHREE